MTRPEKSPIAIVDDDPAALHALAFLLDSLGWESEAFASAQAFLATRKTFAGVIADQHMPGCSGVELAKRLHAEEIGFPIMLLSGDMTPQVTASARAAGIEHIGDKSMSLPAIQAFLAFAE